MVTEDKFLSDLCLKKLKGNLWKLYEDLLFQSKRLDVVYRVDKGTQTDLSSIPRSLYVLYPPIGNYDAAAVIHDAGYNNQIVVHHSGQRVYLYKKLSDLLFLDAMLISGVGHHTATVMYLAVKKFGKPIGPNLGIK